MMRKILVVFILPIIFLACGRQNEETRKIQGDKFLFGTYINITVYEKNEGLAKKAIDAAFDEIERIDNKYNSKVEESLIAKLNSGKLTSISLDEEGQYIFQTLKDVYELSGGNYDPTIGPLLEVWNFGETERKTLPSEDELKEAMKKIDFSKVIIDNNKMYYDLPGLELDTGSFLKGYAVERAKQKMLEMGIKSAFISSISSIETIKTKPGKKEWKIGVENPENPKEILGVISLDDEGMGVSGDYQTYIEIDGKRYHHILNKHTGYPISDKKMILVVCKNAFLADLYSTALFSIPIEKVLDVAEKNNFEVMLVDTDLNISRTQGIDFKCKASK